jgi:DNA-directed RNA polymerase II subunit RPB2
MDPPGKPLSLNSDEFGHATWHVADQCLSQSQLVKHQIDSYNDFVLRKLEHVILGFNPIEIYHEYTPTFDSFKYILRIDITNPILAKPTIHEKDGSTKIMTPSDARLRNFTYAAPIHVNVHITASVLQEDGTYSTETKRLEHVNIGKLPIMVKSRYCVLTASPHLRHNECNHDTGGYFIVNGNEKVVISQDRIAENKTFCFTSNKQTNYSHIAEIRSVQDNSFGVPKATTLKLSAKANHFGRYIRVNMHHVKNDVPLFVVFRALGIESDMSICEFIVQDLDDHANAPMLQELIGSIEDGNHVHTQQQALEYLSRFLNISGYPREIITHPEKRIGIVKSVLAKEFLPHVGPRLDKKAMYLGTMAKKLLGCYMGTSLFDDRDCYVNKRIDSPGVLLTSLFRQYYGKLIKDMRNLLQKEIHGGSWKATNRFINVMTKVNMIKIIKPSIIESGMRYCLATGNWGIKNARNKQGIAQVLNRMNFNATMSHLRRINTPIEKTGKLVQPRKLHSTQWGIVCPSETPDGASVGLVKNMALTAGITITASSANVRAAAEDLGMVPFSTNDIKDYAKYTWVIINGDVMGYAPNPEVVYKGLRDMKRTGQIGIYTSIIWDVKIRQIRACTESGRCVRPLYIVGEDGKLVFGKNHLLELLKGTIGWLQLVGGARLPEATLEPAIEYLDVEESEYAMIAMRHQDIGATEDPNTLPPRHTHLEIHPSLIFGVLTSAIPFSEHNQAPRVTYQSAMGKQAVGVYCTNFRDRYDTMAHVLNYPQRPLVRTRTARLLQNGTMPCGQNAIVAIATHSGYNQEDSIIINESAVQRGLFSSTYYRTYREQNNKNHANGEEEFFCKPDLATTKNLKPYNYDKLADDGFVPENTPVLGGDVIIGRCMPHKENKNIVQKDTSFALKSSNDPGMIDRNCANDKYYVNTNGDGYTFCKVRIRHERIPTIGDKMSCYSPDHDILTTKGWIKISEVTKEHRVATLVDGALVYQNPTKVQAYPYKGRMYSVKSNQVDLLVTPNHRMFVRTRTGKWRMDLAEDIMNERRYYKKNVDAWTPNVSAAELAIDDKFTIPNPNGDGSSSYDLDDWIRLFGVWMAEGYVHAKRVEIVVCKPRVKQAMTEVCERMGLRVLIHSNGAKDPDGQYMQNMMAITNKDVSSYFGPLSVGAVNKYLPEWVWELSMDRCRLLIEYMALGDGHTMANGTVRYDTSSIRLADDFQRLCLHAGWSTNKTLKYAAGHESVKKDGYVIKSTADAWRLTIVKTQNEPLVNKNADNKLDSWKDYDDMVYCCTVPLGYGVIYMRRSGVPVWSGNSCHGQKGTIGMVYRQEDMPFGEDGLVPDIIINPHAIPSRMTIGQLMECLMGQACCSLGTYGDATAFTDIQLSDLTKTLEEKCGMQRFCNQTMYNPRTGHQMHTEIFIGATYYQRLKHMTIDKLHGRNAQGPIVLLTRQPAEGRARDGGLRLGEMEVECLESHGVMGFMKERMMECSDNYRVFVCAKCGVMAIANPEQDMYECRSCQSGVHIREIRCPYSFKLLSQEIQAMGIATRFTI